MEAQLIAARLANASASFPLPHNDVDGRKVAASVVHVESDSASLSITVTDHDGIKREYRSELRPINSETAPVNPVLPAPAEAVSGQPINR